MGGIGSGRTYYTGAKATTDQYKQIDIREWKREGLLEAGTHFDWYWYRRGHLQLALPVRVSEDVLVLPFLTKKGLEEFEGKTYTINIEWTPCGLGGRRPWFLCPAQGCAKRSAILYGGFVFACRHCYQLAYPSTREDEQARAFRKADQLRAKLGWRAGIAHGRGAKPKGMHWETFSKLARMHDLAAHKAMTRVLESQEKLGGLLARLG